MILPLVPSFPRQEEGGEAPERRGEQRELHGPAPTISAVDTTEVVLVAAGLTVEVCPFVLAGRLARVHSRNDRLR